MGQADVFALTGKGAGWLLKDFSRRPWWFRAAVARGAVRREARALRSLREIAGVPRFGGLVDRDAMLIERLDADRLPHRRESSLTPAFFVRLECLVAKMHGRGWAHGDLRRKNILVDADLRPYLIDFATAWRASGRAGPLRRFLLRHWIVVDKTAVARIKASYLPDALTPEDREILDRQPVHLRLGRFLRKKVYRPLKRRHRRRLWREIRSRFGGDGG